MVKNPPGFDPWVRKILWRRAWQSTLVFLPGKSQGQRSLLGHRLFLWGCKESDATEHASSAHLYRLQIFLPEMPFLGFLGSSAGRESVQITDIST